MRYLVFKALDRPSSFMWFRGRFVLFPIIGAVLSIVAIAVLQTLIPILAASLASIMSILVPSIVTGLRLQDKIREKDLSKWFIPKRKNLRISIPAACIKRQYRSELITIINNKNKIKNDF